MKIHTFWSILLRTIGIFLILSSIAVLGQFVSSFMYMGYGPGGSFIQFLPLLVGLIIMLFVFFLIIKFLIFNPNWIIKALRLEKGFTQEEINLNMRMETVLSVAIIVFAGVLLVQALPEFVKSVFQMIQNELLKYPERDFAYVILYGIQLVLAYVLIAHHRGIIRMITKHTKED
ncbi:MAG: hypothetical protein PF448_09810 [Bacteroidales bacterium]|jgi:hypothetical protein|nr:hypothetical protein [Bacteroidales bacterium]